MPSRYDHLRISDADLDARAQMLGFEETDFRAVADFTYDWESWHAPDGRLVWVNFAVERLTGYLPAECLAMDDYPLPIIAPADRELIAKVLQDAQIAGCENDLEFQITHRRGQHLSMAISYQPIYDRNKRHLGFRTSVRDIHERCELREQNRQYAEHLEQLVAKRTQRIQQLEMQRQKMERLAALGQLSARVAHEVNNPLAGIRNAFTLIKGEITENQKHHRLLDLIDAEIERIGSIVHQMHQLYRQDPQASSTFDIRELIGGIKLLLEGVAKQKRIVLEQTSIGTNFECTLPEGQVKQVFYNLLINAIQASPDGERVSIQLTADSDQVEVAISDHGHGIAPDVLPKIFDPFFSTKAGSSKSGMGLGLSVSSSLIEAMGGKIRVETEVKRGSCFSVTLPIIAHPTTNPDL